MDGNRSFFHQAKNSLIFALDVFDSKEAMSLVAQLKDYVGVFKVGLQLFTAEGPDLVRNIVDQGGDVFLDLKLHDIPATVERAAAAAVGLGARMLTVHTGEGAEITAAAVAGAASRSLDEKETLVLGVTVLTSISEKMLFDLGLGTSVLELVSKRASWAVDAGCSGLVCSPLEVKALREQLGPNVRLVVPGVRPEWAQVGRDDQARKATPGDVIRWGGDYVVVGRPIRTSANPTEAAKKIIEELASAFEQRHQKRKVD